MLGLDEAVVAAVLDDWRSAPVDERLRAALGFIERLTREPETLGVEDVAALRAAGLSKRAIREAAYVVYLFSVMDRLADAFDFTMPTETQVAATGRFLNRHGYRLAKLIR